MSKYKVNGSYTWVDGKIGGCPVEKTSIDIKVWSSSSTDTTMKLEVNSKIAGVVKKMFEDIYNDPSHPVIESIGCFRDSDGYPGHPFGVAIDINPDHNPDTRDYAAPYNPASDPLSMNESHPIVKIIRDKYGWDWGGDWNSKKDYMHFSFWGG